MLLLDTHAFVWLVSDLDKLPPAGKHAIRENAGALYLSGISGLEIALAVRRGRLDLPTDPDSFISRGLAQHGVQELPVTASVGCKAAALPDIHNDPFDRLILATALLRDMDILSKDPVFRKYPGVRVTWASSG